MDAHKVDAILLEASCTLFWHLNQFLGTSIFESERKRRIQFPGQ
jgi:hypothetical protein